MNDEFAAGALAKDHLDNFDLLAERLALQVGEGWLDLGGSPQPRDGYDTPVSIAAPPPE